MVNDRSYVYNLGLMFYFLRLCKWEGKKENVFVLKFVYVQYLPKSILDSISIAPITIQNPTSKAILISGSNSDTAN